MGADIQFLGAQAVNLMAKGSDKGYNPNIGVNENVPGKQFALDMAGGFFFFAYISLGVALVLAAITWGFGKLTKTGMAQQVGGMALVVVLVVAVVVGSANGLIYWFSTRNLGV